MGALDYLQWLRQQVRDRNYVLTRHAEIERLEEDIDIVEVEEALLSARILEDYPNDPRGACCLLLGFARRRPLHAICADRQGRLLIVTVYRPLRPHWVAPDRRGN